MSETIKIGTRGSKLALWQTHYIAKILNDGGLKTEIIAIETKGDKNISSTFAEIGTKGLFTEELEDQLRGREIDIAVHSAKDMQSEMGEGLSIIAFTEREDANDVLVSFDKKVSLNDKNLLVGTSSTRRRATLKHFYPHLKVTDARGNLQTRMRKMEEGNYQAMILAYAGVHRMNYDEHIIEKLPLNIFTPAVGQGSIAIESSSYTDENKKSIIRNLLNHEPTEVCLVAERAFLRTLQGGCSIPLFALATLAGNKIHMTGGVISLDGKVLIRESIEGNIKDNEALGNLLAEKVLLKGGDKILNDIRLK
jgi:hydroxymethylbilane synthase